MSTNPIEKATMKDLPDELVMHFVQYLALKEYSRFSAVRLADEDSYRYMT